MRVGDLQSTANCEASEGPSVDDDCGHDEELSLSFDNETSSSPPHASSLGHDNVQASDGLSEDSQLEGGGGSTQFTENGNQEEPASQNIDASGETLTVPTLPEVCVFTCYYTRKMPFPYIFFLFYLTYLILSGRRMSCLVRQFKS